jgi:hypothetical protein
MPTTTKPTPPPTTTSSRITTKTTLGAKSSMLTSTSTSNGPLTHAVPSGSGDLVQMDNVSTENTLDLESQTNSPAMIGGIVGAAVGLLCIIGVIAVVVVIVKRRNNQNHTQTQTRTPQPETQSSKVDYGQVPSPSMWLNKSDYDEAFLNSNRKDYDKGDISSFT